MKIAIIGAGLTGLACADAFESAGIACVLFDKGRKPGGRMSSLQLDGLAWDFGAQYFTAGSGSFAQQVAEWQAAGIVAPWREGPEGALVGVPAMASIISAQCRDRDVRFGAHIQRLDRVPAGWMLAGPDFAEGPFDAVIVCLPPEQAIPLVALHDFDLARQYVGVHSAPCWTVMAAFAEPLDLPAYLRGPGPVAWAARNNSKPGRPQAECWVVQASAEWSRSNLELARDEAASALLREFRDASGGAVPEPTFLKAHRWLFAMASLWGGRSGWNEAIGLGVCGDWCVTPKVEGAWRSGHELAMRVLETLTPLRQRVARN